MKKKNIILGAMLSLTLLLTSWTIAKQEDGAVQINDFTCKLFDGERKPFFTDKSKTVITPSENRMLSCKASDVPNKTGKTVKWNYENTKLGCRIFGKITKDWDEVLTPNGNASFMCKIN